MIFFSESKSEKKFLFVGVRVRENWLVTLNTAKEPESFAQDVTVHFRPDFKLSLTSGMIVTLTLGIVT